MIYKSLRLKVLECLRGGLQSDRLITKRDRSDSVLNGIVLYFSDRVALLRPTRRILTFQPVFGVRVVRTLDKSAADATLLLCCMK